MRKALVLLLALTTACTQVPAGHRGVETYGGKVSTVLDEGVHFGIGYWFNPLVAVDLLTVQVQADDAQATASSKDLQNVTTDVTLNWQRDVGAVQRHFEEYPSIRSRVIQPAIQESVKAITARYTAEELITKRPEAKAAIQDQLTTRLGEVGVNVLALSITNFSFSRKFDDAIEAKMEAEQRALKAERELQRIEIEARQAIAAAEGQKQAAILAAQGEAEAINIQGEALRKNPTVIDLRRVEKWDGKLPEYMSEDGSMLLRTIK